MCSTPHGVVAVCTGTCSNTSRLRTAVNVLNASRRRCCLHVRRTALIRYTPRASVLNASRRRCCLHAAIEVARQTWATCSTPHGVVAVCTCRDGTSRTAPSGAQRLTASLLSALWSACRRKRVLTVLNASRRRCCLHPPGTTPGWLSPVCSTPHGVVAVCTRTSGCRAGGATASAQRLTASLLSARVAALGVGQVEPVLNASRRRCCLHPAAARLLPGGRECSTPHGVVAVCTSAQPEGAAKSL